MLQQRLSMGSACLVALLIVSAWIVTAQSDDEVGEKDRSKQASKSDDAAAVERFDYLVREDLFAGFTGDQEALQRGLKACEDTLDQNPRHAEALVWRGAARVFLSGQAFEKGDQVAGLQYWTTGIKDMDDAVEIAPDNIGVLIPRAAVLLPAARDAPPFVGKPVLMKVRADFERTYERQKEVLDQLGEHPLGELRMGMADVYRLLGQAEKSQMQLEAVIKELPETAYAKRASEWLKAAPDQKLAHNCIGCHTK